MKRVFAIFAVLACCVGGALPAGAASRPKDLWATVNVCDTKLHDNMMGVRASMPGDGTTKRMRVRFTAQWYSKARRGWVPVDGVPSSPWLDAGTAEYLYQQAGWTFSFDRATGGNQYQLRGLAVMEWLKGRRVVRSTTRATRAGAVGVFGGSSRAGCVLG